MREIYKSENDSVVVKIEYDGFVSNPRENDELVNMVIWHKSIPSDEHNFENPTEFMEWYNSQEDQKLMIKPLFAHVHGNISLSTTMFSCPWDSGQIGYAYITQHAADSVIGFGNYDSESLSKSIENSLKAYQYFLNGECYSVEIFDKKTGESQYSAGHLGYIDLDAVLCVIDEEQREFVDVTLGKCGITIE